MDTQMVLHRHFSFRQSFQCLESPNEFKGFKSANSTCLKFYFKNSSYTITFTNARFILNQSFNFNFKGRNHCAFKSLIFVLAPIRPYSGYTLKMVGCWSFSFLKRKSCQHSYRGRPELAYKITNSNDKIDQLYSLRHLRNGLIKLHIMLKTSLNCLFIHFQK